MKTHFEINGKILHKQNTTHGMETTDNSIFVDCHTCLKIMEDMDEIELRAMDFNTPRPDPYTLLKELKRDNRTIRRENDRLRGVLILKNKEITRLWKYMK